MDKPWNGTCPSCGDTRAYQSFLNWECPNLACKYYTKAQEDLVDSFEEEPPDRPAIAPPFPPNKEEKDNATGVTTIPFYPTSGYNRTTQGTDPNSCDPVDDDSKTTPILSQAGDPDDQANYSFDMGTNPLDWDGFDQGFYTSDD